MRIAIATDAWHPQVNGVVRTIDTTARIVASRGHDVAILSPDQFRTIACPGYSEIRLAIAPRIRLRKRLHVLNPDIVHIATEGPIGWSARGWCLSHGIPFTSAFHTRFPDYAAVRTGLSPDVFWPTMRRFHAPSQAVLTSTASLMDELKARGFANTRLWSRGIDTALFRPDVHPLASLSNLPRPVLLSVGRVAVEKNLESFLSTETSGTKVVVGDGPMLETLRRRFPEVIFTGALFGDALASAYAAADVFVFPSKTDTFGLVMIEALACGVPVAAYPVPGPLDIVGGEGRGPRNDLPSHIGAVDHDLRRAIELAMRADRTAVASYGRAFSWETSANQFVDALMGAFSTALDCVA
ncbi:MAG: glycosyltransferase family 1 protein [Sphingomonadales bacterium]|nr:glycosyltransferase family 1 protein [Sphingomonadales bacterium]